MGKESIRLKRLEKLALQRASEIVLFELADPRMTMVTLTRVELAHDLSHGVIFWSTLGEGGAKSKTEHALRDAAPYVQSAIAKVFHTRRTPHITFRFDESIAGAIRVSNILDKLAKDRGEEPGGADSQPSADEKPGGEEE